MANLLKKKSARQIEKEQENKLLEGVAAWCSYYRSNPQKFVRDYLNINLKPFQKILIYQMMHNNHFMYWASRGQGKTYLTAIFCVVRCILYPKTKVCVASGTREQANEVLQKITDDFMKLHDWGSENLCREITYNSVGANKAEIHFANGSWIKVVTAADSGRHSRANVLVVDEFVKVKRKTINTVLKRFLTSPRQPNYLNNPKYADLAESNIEMYMSSCWFKNHWSFEKSKAFTVNMLGGRNGYYVCALPYQLAIKDGLLKRIDVEDEMSEADFDETTFGMEMECIPFGSYDDSFFSFDDVSNCRVLNNAVYPPNYKIKDNKNLQIPDLVMGERRILSLDVALMASKKHKNDASCAIINSALPSNNSLVGNAIYIKTWEGLNTDELALEVRRLYHQYKCTDLVIDTNGLGLGVFDMLIQDITDPDTGEIYPALSCCNNEDMAARCKVDDAPKVIWSIKGNSTFNSQIALNLRSGFQKGKMKLLVSEYECDEVLADRITGYKKMQEYQKTDYKLPYIETTLLVYELIKLKHEAKGTNIKLEEESGMRKDRYSSLAYNYWVQCQLELDSREHKTGFDAQDYANKLRKLNRKPKIA